jgi:integrase
MKKRDGPTRDETDCKSILPPAGRQAQGCALLGNRTACICRRRYDSSALRFRAINHVARKCQPLAAAKITYRDADGRVFDFHALRHQFISNLARGGVHPKEAQALARHSTITLTMDRYTHLALADLTSALDRLPAIGVALNS